MVFKGIGVQLETVYGTSSINTEFVPWNDVEEVVILEGFARFEIVTRLLFARTHNRPNIVPFKV